MSTVCSSSPVASDASLPRSHDIIPTGTDSSAPDSSAMTTPTLTPTPTPTIVIITIPANGLPIAAIAVA